MADVHYIPAGLCRGEWAHLLGDLRKKQHQRQRHVCGYCQTTSKSEQTIPSKVLNVSLRQMQLQSFSCTKYNLRCVASRKILYLCDTVLYGRLLTKLVPAGRKQRCSGSYRRNRAYRATSCTSQERLLLLDCGFWHEIMLINIQNYSDCY